MSVGNLDPMKNFLAISTNLKFFLLHLVLRYWKNFNREGLGKRVQFREQEGVVFPAQRRRLTQQVDRRIGKATATLI